MSNKRRKSIGQRKLRRNWLIRQARGSGGDDWQGDGRQYRADKGWVLAPDVKRRKDELIAEMQDLVVPYWAGCNLYKDGER